MFLQIVILENMVLDASRNVVAVQIWVTVTSTLENVRLDVILDTTLPSAKKVSFSVVVPGEKCEGAFRRYTGNLISLEKGSRIEFNVLLQIQKFAAPLCTTQVIKWNHLLLVQEFHSCYVFMYFYHKIINTNLSKKINIHAVIDGAFFQCLHYLFISILIKVSVHSAFH